MAMIAGIYSSIYARGPVNKTAGVVVKKASGAKRRARKAAKRASK